MIWKVFLSTFFVSWTFSIAVSYLARCGNCSIFDVVTLSTFDFRFFTEIIDSEAGTCSADLNVYWF
jgi:hypothetical protein